MNSDLDLQELARLYGVQTAYHDALGQHREATPESLLAILAALDAPVFGMADVEEALRERRAELDARLLEPVAVAWEGGPLELDLRLGREDGTSLALHVDLEDGGRRGWSFEPAALPLAADGSRKLTLPEKLPPGYHQLRLATARRAAEAMVISAPRRAFGAEGDPIWGVFLPLYALRTRRSWGAGDLSDLGDPLELGLLPGRRSRRHPPPPRRVLGRALRAQPLCPGLPAVLERALFRSPGLAGVRRVVGGASAWSSRPSSAASSTTSRRAGWSTTAS